MSRTITFVFPMKPWCCCQLLTTEYSSHLSSHFHDQGTSPPLFGVGMLEAL